MNGKHLCWASLLVFGVMQSCTNDFDKFEVGDAGSGATASGGTLSLSGASSGTLNTVAGRRPDFGGTTGSDGGSDAGESPGGTPALPEAGGAGAGGIADVAGAGGFAPEPPCGGVCELEHATASCVENACVIDDCSQTWGDCNETPADGCEQSLSADASYCGSCGNQCPTGFVCVDGRCGCDFKADCGNGSGVQCAAGLCQCDLTSCRPGERCRDVQGDKLCSCNGAEGCLDDELCCEDSGCTDVQSNAQSCGACGRACTAGFVCEAGDCQCDGADDCGGVNDADGGAGGAGGEPGTSGGAAGATQTIACVSGVCVCQGVTCPAGQRCLPNGSCG